MIGDMKKWLTLAAVALLAVTNGITLVLLSNAIAHASDFRAQLQSARVEAAKAESLELELETTKTLLALTREAYGNAEREAMIEVIERWKALYEESMKPITVGERINRAVITGVSPSTITIMEDDGESYTLKIGEVSALLRPRAALAMAAATP